MMQEIYFSKYGDYLRAIKLMSHVHTKYLKLGLKISSSTLGTSINKPYPVFLIKTVTSYNFLTHIVCNVEIKCNSQHCST